MLSNRIISVIKYNSRCLSTISKINFNAILACDSNGGIGNGNYLPWDFKNELQFFREMTKRTELPETKNAVIMGRKTMESLPKKYLPGRHNIVLTSKVDEEKKDRKYYANSLTKCLNIAKKLNAENIWVIGGASVYEQAFRHPNFDKLYLTKINGVFDCDTFVNLPKFKNYKSNSLKEFNNIDDREYEMSFNIGTIEKNCETQYLELLQDVLINGELRDTRNAKTYSLFDKTLSWDLNDGFPLLTTKKMFWKGIVEELLFFIRGETNTKILEDQGIKIWKGNTTREFLDSMGFDYSEGEMGPMYGYQWRFFNKPYAINNSNKGIDQFKNIIEEIKTNPSSRRLLMTDYNPSQVREGVLYPCHSLLLQFYVEDKNLSVKMYQRSADVFLGLPFNIASTSLLLHIIAKLTNLNPYKVSITLGDVHIYENHIDAVNKQLDRTCLKLPNLELPHFETLEDVEKTTFKDYKIKNYNHQSAIKADMVA